MPILGAGSFPVVGPTSGGKVYAFNNLTTTPQVVAPANSKRATITFDNPGTVDIIIAPVNVQAYNPIWTSTTSIDSGSPISNVALTPTNIVLGGGYRIFANGGSRTFTGECQGAWQALSISSSNNPLTVTDSNA
jgi:hypothetical protein